MFPRRLRAESCWRFEDTNLEEPLHTCPGALQAQRASAERTVPLLAVAVDSRLTTGLRCAAACWRTVWEEVGREL
jgi:hypothetical protein